MTRGQPVATAIKDTFNDRDKAADPTGSGFCPACCFSFLEQTEINGKPNQRMRNYSHLVIAGNSGQWQTATKGEKGKILAFLLEPKPQGVAWFACIAESGQKHLLFRCPVTFGGSDMFRIQFEERQLFTSRAALGRAMILVEKLMNLGFSKTEIASGSYDTGKLYRGGPGLLAEWGELEQGAKKWRGQGVFDLSIFLAQRKEDPEEEESEVTDFDGTSKTAAANNARLAPDGGSPGIGNPPLGGLADLGGEEADLLGDAGKRDKGKRVHDQPGEVQQLSMW